MDIAQIVQNARNAKKELERLDQHQIDNIVMNIARYVYDNARDLAVMAVEETGIGNVEDKVLKNLGKSSIIWNDLRDKPSRGIIGCDSTRGLKFIAKPVGVVGAVTPITNPIVTMMCNAMFAIKCGNSIIFAPHPKARKCANVLCDAFNMIVGIKDVIQVIAGTLDDTKEMMKLVDVVVATGGGPMVKSAYSSGKPAYGVGPGNVQVLVDRITGDMQKSEIVDKIIAGASFDNGLICSHEQFVFLPLEQYDDYIDAFVREKRAWYSDDINVNNAIKRVIYKEDGSLDPRAIGRSAIEISSMANIEVPPTTKILLLRSSGFGTSDALCREKLCPVVGVYPYETSIDAVIMMKDNLNLEGRGHSVAIHTNNQYTIDYLGMALDVSRVVVNQTSATSAGGSWTNGFTPTTTLGCGSWGGNSISENLSFKHLMNVTQIGMQISSKRPRDDEFWKL